MSTRIRYSKNEGVLTSIRVFPLGSDITARVVLDTTNMSFIIEDVNTGNVLRAGGKTKNLTVLKNQARRAIMELGAGLVQEHRNRIFTSTNS